MNAHHQQFPTSVRLISEKAVDEYVDDEVMDDPFPDEGPITDSEIEREHMIKSLTNLHVEIKEFDC